VGIRSTSVSYHQITTNLSASWCFVDHVNSIENETGRLADSVEKERNASIQAILHHTRGVSLASQKSSDLTAKDDPWFTHTVAERQLLKQLEEENSL
jgi:hypothetical protein